MGGWTNYQETIWLNRAFRRTTTTVDGGNASTTNILVASSTDFHAGDLVKLTTPGSYHLVTAIPDGTHITISPAAAVAPTTGSVEAWGHAPPAVYVGLFTAAPSDAGGGTEVTGGSYARQQATQANATWSAPSGTPRGISNPSAITYPQATADWGTVTHVGIFDAVSGGNLIMWAALSAPRAVPNGATAKFDTSALSLTLD